MKFFAFVLFLSLSSAIAANAQPRSSATTDQSEGNEENTVKPVSYLTFSGYAEVYYGFDFNRPSNNLRPSFVYSHNRHNEFALNLSFIKAAYDNGKVRANLALMAGTYSNANLAAEPGVLKNLFEANAGVRISKKKALWIDAGLFASHIGYESAIGKDCWTLTRSMMADNSPYYETGARLSYSSDNGKWYMAGLVLNGWQRIQRVDGNSTPAFGTQITFKPSDKATINWSTFIGNDKPDSVHQTRFFNNFYGIFQPTEIFGITAGFDIGMEQKLNADDWNIWYTPNLVLRAKFGARSAVALRGEYYYDKNGVIITSGTPNGFQTLGASLNYDLQILDNALFRIEGKMYSSKDAVFMKENQMVTTSPSITTSLSVAF